MQLIDTALCEDIIDGKDVTSDEFISDNVEVFGWIEARSESIVSGLDVTEAVFKRLDSNIEIENLTSNGDSVQPGQRVQTVSGRAHAVLSAERTALNFLCHLSGIATQTAEFIRVTRKWNTEILCTRKTTPGLRALEIAAVENGGGRAYRTNLSSEILLKDNHLSIAGGLNAVAARLKDLRDESPERAEAVLQTGKVEVSTLEELGAAVKMGWRNVLLDNFTPAMAKDAVRLWGKKLKLEISGGVDRNNIIDYASSGVHAISVGALTHSVKAADFALEVEGRES